MSSLGAFNGSSLKNSFLGSVLRARGSSLVQNLQDSFLLKEVRFYTEFWDATDGENPTLLCSDTATNFKFLETATLLTKFFSSSAGNQNWGIYPISENGFIEFSADDTFSSRQWSFSAEISEPAYPVLFTSAVIEQVSNLFTVNINVDATGIFSNTVTLKKPAGWGLVYNWTTPLELISSRLFFTVESGGGLVDIDVVANTTIIKRVANIEIDIEVPIS